MPIVYTYTNTYTLRKMCCISVYINLVLSMYIIDQEYTEFIPAQRDCVGIFTQKQFFLKYKSNLNISNKIILLASSSL